MVSPQSAYCAEDKNNAFIPSLSAVALTKTEYFLPLMWVLLLQPRCGGDFRNKDLCRAFAFHLHVVPRAKRDEGWLDTPYVMLRITAAVGGLVGIPCK